MALVTLLLGPGCQLAARDTPTPQSPRQYQGDSRPFLMGFSALPIELNEEEYRRAFRTAGQFGEVILLQRPPAWEEFREGAAIAEETARTTEVERDLARELGLKIFVSVDLIDPANRDRVALPEDWEGMSLADEEVRNAYLAYVEYMAVNYRPEYMALGVEVNLLYEQDREEFENFLSLYREAYERVKRASPSTLVFVTFQYEELLGLTPWKNRHEPRWELVDLFEPALDLFAISTYPSFVFASADDIPEDYYSRVSERVGLPPAIAEAGYSSGPGPSGVNSGTEGDQARYLRRLLRDGEELAAELVVWFASADPAFAGDPPYDLFRSIGLLRRDGSAKLAWQYWQETVRRPPVGVAAQ